MDIPEGYEDLLVNMDPLSANEVKSTIDNMKLGKARGADGVSAEMLKVGGDVITETLKYGKEKKYPLTGRPCLTF